MSSADVAQTHLQCGQRTPEMQKSPDWNRCMRASRRGISYWGNAKTEMGIEETGKVEWTLDDCFESFTSHTADWETKALVYPAVCFCYVMHSKSTVKKYLIFRSKRTHDLQDTLYPFVSAHLLLLEQIFSIRELTSVSVRVNEARQLRPSWHGGPCERAAPAPWPSSDSDVSQTSISAINVLYLPSWTRTKRHVPCEWTSSSHAVMQLVKSTKSPVVSPLAVLPPI